MFGLENKIKWGLLIGLFFVMLNGFTQVHTDTLTAREAKKLQKRFDKELAPNQKKLRVQYLPVIYYTPETKMAFGATAIGSFKFDFTDSLLKVSQVTPSFVYTLNNQMMAQIAYNLNPNRNWEVSGRFGYFIYPYFFAGVGNQHNANTLAFYDAEYPVFELNIYRLVYKDIVSLGLKYSFQNTSISSDKGLVLTPDIAGANGSTESSLGFGAKLETRDYKLSATKGWFIDFSVMWNEEAFGGSYQDQFLKLDIRKYISLTPKKDVLALQVYSEIHSGDVPFNLMSMLGGSQSMRGYQRGIYRDRQMMVYQAEFRSRLFFKYLAFTVFGNYGAIGNNFQDANKNYRYTYGAGLRYTPIPEKRYFIRFDYGRGQNTEGFYIGVGEAF